MLVRVNEYKLINLDRVTKAAQSELALAKTKIDLIEVINSIVCACGEYYETIKGGYDVVFNFE